MDYPLGRTPWFAQFQHFPARVERFAGGIRRTFRSH
jgi:hypothetical protein